VETPQLVVAQAQALDPDPDLALALAQAQRPLQVLPHQLPVLARSPSVVPLVSSLLLLPFSCKFRDIKVTTTYFRNSSSPSFTRLGDGCTCYQFWDNNTYKKKATVYNVFYVLILMGVNVL
jgi:hypothetical protein